MEPTELSTEAHNYCLDEINNVSANETSHSTFDKPLISFSPTQLIIKSSIKSGICEPSSISNISGNILHQCDINMEGVEGESIPSLNLSSQSAKKEVKSPPFLRKSKRKRI